MATLKCKMCGGDLQLIEDSTICECEYCGSKQTVPVADNEKKMNLFARANRLRFNCEFDKAAGIYESIIGEFPEEPEAYWGLLLCKYGIEYVDDPATGKKIPTCHRSSFESVMEDENLELATEYADLLAKRLYREEAKQIEELRKCIIEVSSSEEPYDIFICYKETDENGDRTLDSVIAQDIYNELTEKGYRVFFSRITLEDKLGQEYEPYIFAALHSAKVMLAVGTQFEYYDAVWVKNEWSRYLKLIAAGEKKTLIPCYKNLDAYDMPKEFARLQAQDMGKVGAMQDLLRGIDKIFGKDKSQVQIEAQAQNPAGYNLDIGMSALNAQTAALLKRGEMALEDGEFDKASGFFEQVLNNDAECGQAYWGKMLCAKKTQNADELAREIISRILAEKKSETYTLNLPEEDLSKLAKEADIEKGVLNEFTDWELNTLFNIYQSTIEYESAESYYKNILSILDESGLKAYIDDRNYDRAILFADDVILANNEKILMLLKEFLDTVIIQEEKKTEELKQPMSGYDDAVKTAISELLRPIPEEYEKKKNEEEVAAIAAQKKAEEKAERAYQAAFEAFEMQYKAIVEKREAEYQTRVSIWKAAKAKYDEDYAIAVKKQVELQEKISQLEMERDNVKGLFAGKKKKEIEENIAVLRNSFASVILPKAPGEMPSKPVPPIKGNAPRKELYVTRTNISRTSLTQYVKQKISSKIWETKPVLFLANKGDKVSFGRYSQGIHGEIEPLEWTVLEVLGNKKLIISTYGIDVIPYNETAENTSWEKSTIRKWLNSDFISNAFLESERKMIVETDSINDSQISDGDTPPVIDTVFLLSSLEAASYYSNDSERVAQPSLFAKHNGAYVDGNGNCWWWLRSFGTSPNAEHVSGNGNINRYGTNVSNVNNCVRPALWVDVSTLFA